MVLTWRQTPRFCGHWSRSRVLPRRFWTTRGFRISWLIVGISVSLALEAEKYTYVKCAVQREVRSPDGPVRAPKRSLIDHRPAVAGGAALEGDLPLAGGRLLGRGGLLRRRGRRGLSLGLGLHGADLFLGDELL